MSILILLGNVGLFVLYWSMWLAGTLMAIYAILMLLAVVWMFFMIWFRDNFNKNRGSRR